VEAPALAHRVGDSFDALVVEAAREGGGGKVQLADPAVLGRCDGDLTAGEQVRVRLVQADPDSGTVRFAIL
jgi:hypothetical protein